MTRGFAHMGLFFLQESGIKRGDHSLERLSKERLQLHFPLISTLEQKGPFGDKNFSCVCRQDEYRQGWLGVYHKLSILFNDVTGVAMVRVVRDFEKSLHRSVSIRANDENQCSSRRATFCSACRPTFSLFTLSGRSLLQSLFHCFMSKGAE